jgi:hypothetical protein
VTVPAVTWKETDVDPAGTVADAGVASSELLSDNATVCPPVGAPALRVAVHVAEAPLLRPDGAHTSEVSAAAVPTVPPVPAAPAVPPVANTEINVPARDAATLLLNPMATAETLAAVDRFTVATTPFEMIFELIPDAMQVYAPETGAQDIVFPALVSAGPAMADIEATEAGGYVNVHWMAAGSLPDGEVSVNDSDAPPPVSAPDDNDKEMLCAWELRTGNRHRRESAGKIAARAKKLFISCYQLGGAQLLD